MLTCKFVLWQVALGKFEGGDLSQGFMRMGDKAELLSRSALEQSSGLTFSFEAPLKVPSRPMLAWGFFNAAETYVSAQDLAICWVVYGIWGFNASACSPL